jgi:ribosome maturation factor RimP
MDNKTLKQLIVDQNLKLYDTEVIQAGDTTIYRVYIMGKNGTSLEECTRITKIISPILDMDPPVNGEYTLEVSSPGIDRKLTKLDHFKNSIDGLVKVKLMSGNKLKCKIISVKDSDITLYDKSKKENFVVKFDDIVKAKTYFEWS